MDIRHIKVFAAVADAGSFSAASRKLGVAQPPLSRHVQQLERDLGVTLFVRTARGIELTPEGTLMLDRARTLLDQAAAFERAAEHSRTGVLPLRVGLAWGLWEIINRLRKRLAAETSIVPIEGRDMSSAEQYQALHQGTIDTGLLRRVAEDASITYEPLFHERFAVVMRSDHPLARSRKVRLAQLRREPLLLHERPFAASAYDKILGLYSTAGVTPTVVTVHSRPGALEEMLAIVSGSGISLALESRSSRSYVQVEGIATVPLDEPGAALEVGMARRSDESSPAVTRLIGLAREVTSRDFSYVDSHIGAASGT